MNPEFDQLKQRVEYLENIIKVMTYSDRFVFSKSVQMQDGRNFQLGKGTGTKIGTEITQKLAFFGTTPVIQYTTHFNGTAGSSYGSTEQNIINNLQAALKTYGLIIA